MKGKVIVVTGGNSGIGFEVCKELSSKYGATVILACRSSDRGRIAVEQIRSKFPSADIRFEELDLCSFESICRFAKKINRAHTELYALVNNAGIFYNTPELTKDGFEKTFQTNYLGSFLLTSNLLPLLRYNSSQARIVNVSSEAQFFVSEFPKVDFHLAFPDSAQSKFESYFYSKFCLVLWSRQLSRILEDELSSVSVHCIDPGNVETNIFRNFPPLATPLYYWLQKPIRIWCIKTPYEGAQSIFLALLEENQPPFYIKNLKPALYNQLCDDKEYGEKLWRFSHQYCSAWIN